MKLRKILIAILVIFTLFSISCKKNDTYEDKLKQIKVGMTEKQIISIMGDYDDMDPFNMDYDNNIYYKALYWFDNVDSIMEAEAKREKGMNVKYYCVIVYSTDLSTYKVSEKEDIFSGWWGIE